MPTTRLKNSLYRFMLPFQAPRPDRPLRITVDGAPFHELEKYARMLRKYRVWGSAALFSSGEHQTVLLSSSTEPRHMALRNTMFRVASITKMAVALCALVYCEKGLLDLYAPFSAYFPGEMLPGFLDRISLQHLLSHTSGITDPPSLEEDILAGRPFPEILRNQAAPDPGTCFQYSNLGFGLIGCLLEAVSGHPVSRVLEETVFVPLHMRATLDASSLNPDEIMPICRVLPYKKGREVRVTRLGSIPLKEADPIRHCGYTSGGMYTDIDSLFRLVQCLKQGGRPLLHAAAGMMQKQTASYGKLSPTLSYGSGLLIIQDHALSPHRILGHQGFAYGCADGAFWEEETGNTVLFLNGGCSEERIGRLGRCNYDLLRLTMRKELPQWP